MNTRVLSENMIIKGAFYSSIAIIINNNVLFVYRLIDNKFRVVFTIILFNYYCLPTSSNAQDILVLFVTLCIIYNIF